MDIASKLFPNLLTLLTQLLATGILYLAYRKYVHQPVMDFLSRQAEEIDQARQVAHQVEEGASRRQAELEANYQADQARLAQAKEAMVEEARAKGEEIIQEAQAERDYLISQAYEEIRQARLDMERELQEEALDLAVGVTQKTLEGYELDEDILYLDLARQLERTQ